MNPVNLRVLEQNHVHQVSEIHKKTFPDSLLTIFGNTVSENYYAWQMTPPNQCYAIGYWLNERLAGYCFAGIFKDSEIGFLKRSWKNIVIYVFSHPQILFRKIFLQRAISMAAILKEHLNKPTRRDLSVQVSKDQFGILAIAVNPECQRAGIGHLLLSEAESYAHRNHYEEMRLSVHVTNQNAVKFYESHGWIKKTDRFGQWNGQMVKNLIQTCQ